MKWPDRKIASTAYTSLRRTAHCTCCVSLEVELRLNAIYSLFDNNFIFYSFHKHRSTEVRLSV